MNGPFTREGLKRRPRPGGAFAVHGAALRDGDRHAKVVSRARSWETARVYSPVPRAREASATPSGSAGPGPRRLGWWARVAGLGLVVAVLAVGGGRAAPATNPATQPPLVEADRLVAYDGDNREHFGFAVAVDGNTLAVGSSHATVGSERDQGAVYVYVRSGGEWTLQAKLTAADGAADDQLRIRGRPARRPARRGRPVHDRDHGAVYAFRRTGTNWTQDPRITGRRATTATGSGGRSTCPARRWPSAPLRGSAERHRRRRGAPVHRHADPGGGPSSWTEAARLTASDADSDDNFGFSVALDGARLLVGAPSRDATAEDDGAVYAFARSDAVWSERERLTAPTPAAGEHFGTAVALDGDDAVVGAPGRDGDGRDQGAAFAFAYAAGGWTHAQTLTIPAGEEHNDAEFGAAVALDAGTLAVGAPRNPSPEGNQGLVYTFSGDDGAWAPPQTLIAHDASRGARVGAAVAVSGTRSSPARPTTTSRRRAAADQSRAGVGHRVGRVRRRRRRVHHRPGRAADRARPRRARQRRQPERRSAYRGARVRTRARHARRSTSTARSRTSRRRLQWRRRVQLPGAARRGIIEPRDRHDHRPPAPDRRPGQLQHPAGHAAGRDRADRRAGQRHQWQRRPADRPPGRPARRTAPHPQRGRLVHLHPGRRLQRPRLVHLHAPTTALDARRPPSTLDRHRRSTDAAGREPRRLQHRPGHAADRHAAAGVLANDTDAAAAPP